MNWREPSVLLHLPSDRGDKDCATGSEWQARAGADLPVITHPHFTATGTRTLQDHSKRAIDELFNRSFE